MYVQTWVKLDAPDVRTDMQGSQNVPATSDFTGYFWLSAVYKFVKNKNRSW
jgi:hypothetical protein